jgi:hypothetical protein
METLICDATLGWRKRHCNITTSDTADHCQLSAQACQRLRVNGKQREFNFTSRVGVQTCSELAAVFAVPAFPLRNASPIIVKRCPCGIWEP